MKLLNGDCLKLLPLIPDNSVDMILVDLPYGTTQNGWDSVIPLDTLWAEYNRICKPNAAMVFTAQPPFDKILGASNIKNLKYEWIWHKNKATGHLNAKKMPMKAHENILVFYRKLPTYNPQKTSGHVPRNGTLPEHQQEGVKRNYNCDKTVANPGGQTDRYPRSILEIPVMNNDNKRKVHPTQKPVELMRYLIRTYTNEGDVVLDNTMGAGTTGVACKMDNRDFIGMEMDEEYYRYACKWIDETVYEPWEYKPESSYGYLKPEAARKLPKKDTRQERLI